MPSLSEFFSDFWIPIVAGSLVPVFLKAYDYVRNTLPLVILRPGNKVGTLTPEDCGLAYEHVGLKVTPTIELDAYFIPATTDAKANLIILHGVGSCKEVYLPFAERLCAMGYNIFMADQRQHGKSGGRYLTYGHHEKHDVGKMVDWLAERTGNLRTGIYGNSMGAAVALQAMAIDERIAFGLIESTFTDLPAVTHAYARRLAGFPLPRWLTDYVLRRAGRIADFDPWTIRPVDAAGRIDRPLQFIHGDADGRINVAHGNALYAASPAEDKHFYVVPGGDHADLWEAGDTGYPERWYGFLQRMLREPVVRKRRKFIPPPEFGGPVKPPTGVAPEDQENTTD